MYLLKDRMTIDILAKYLGTALGNIILLGIRDGKR